MRQDWAGGHIVILNWRDLDHPQSGGAEVFAERMAEQFAAAGARVTLVAALPSGLPASSERLGFTIHRSGGTFGVYPAALRWLATHRREIDAVIDCQNGIPFFSPLVLPRRTPVVQIIHHVHQRQFGLFFSPVAAAIGRRLESHGARFVYGRRPSVSVSPSTRTEVRSLLGLRGPRYLVPNGLDLPADSGQSERSSTPTIVCVGRLVPHKRLELLLQAIPALRQSVPELTVHLVGDGPDEARLHDVGRQLALDPHALVWHGRLPSKDRDRLLAQAWLTVNPTHGEGWGIGVMEAAALGVPALAFDVPGLRDSVLDGTTGWLIDEGSDLSRGIVQALDTLADPQVALAYRKSCLDWAANFGWERSAELLASILSNETRRLAEVRRERRRPDDCTCVLDGIEAVAAGGASSPGFRATDLVYAPGQAAQTRSVLLYGADVEGARRARSRVMGVTPGDGAPATHGIREAGDSEYLRAASTGRSARSSSAS